MNSPSSRNRSIALFDLDGTLTRYDTFVSFLKYTHGALRFYGNLVLLFPTLVLFKLRWIADWKAKKALIKRFYANWPAERMHEKGKAFALNILPGMILPAAMEKLKEHRHNNDLIVIVTASCKIWLEPWAVQQGFDLIATELETVNGRITGAFATPNCKGQEKVRRIKERYNLKDFDTIFAYGNEPADLPMLELASERFYRPF